GVGGEGSGRGGGAGGGGGHGRGNRVGGVLHLGDEDLVAPPQRVSESVGDEVQAVGGPAREDDFLTGGGPDEALDAIARDLVELGRFLAERVDGAMHVGVAALVVAGDRLEPRPGRLARRGGGQ